MAKLYFRHGPMDSAKTLNLLAVAHNYRSQGKRVAIMKPQIDRRSGARVESRSGLSAEADYVITGASSGIIDFITPICDELVCILVDEVQFLSPSDIDILRWIVDDLNIPVICYGLRSDFLKRSFAGSRRLFEVADTIEEIRTICSEPTCGSKAVFNARIGEDGKIDRSLDLPQVQIGFHFKPLCSRCYHADS